MDLQMAYGAIYFEINLISFALILLIQIKTAGISKMVAQRNFSMAVGSEMLFIISDTLYVSMKHGLLPYNAVVAMAAKEAYFFATTLLCFFWFLYFEHLQGSPFVRNRMRVFVSSALVWVMAALLVVNVSTGVLFYVDEAGDYHRGVIFGVQYLLSYLYVFVTCTRAAIGVLRTRDAERRGKLLPLALFPLVPAAAGMLQYRRPELPLAGAALAYETLALYLDWTEEMISVDPLTHLNNRKQLTYSFEQWRRGGEADTPLYLMIVDADRFKAINDTYGHIEGDAALLRIAEALRMACREYPRRTNIARYGGDEFVVLAWADDIARIDALGKRVEEIVGELNRAAGAPYQLGVSVGAARADGHKTLRELIEAADRRLYEEKSRHHGRA